MSRITPLARRRRLIAIVAVAALAATFAATALAASLALKVTKHAKVTSVQGVTTHPNVVVNAKGMVLYTLTGDSRMHPECTKGNGCLKFWPPATVKSAKKLAKAPGVKGRLGTWKRNGFIQLTLDGHPLYTFVNDTRKGVATGEGLSSFGGTWHVRLAAPAGKKAPLSPAPNPGGGGW